MLRRLPGAIAAGHGRALASSSSSIGRGFVRGSGGRGAGRGAIAEDLPPRLPRANEKQTKRDGLQKRWRRPNLPSSGRGAAPVTHPPSLPRASRNPKLAQPRPRRSQALIFEDSVVERSRRIRRKSQSRKSVTPPTPICVSNRGVSVRQLAAVANVPAEKVFEAAKTVDDLDSVDALLSGVVLEMVVETANLNVKVEFIKPLWDGKPPVGSRPVVAVMGHVDHGKTTLLDKLRGAHVADDEVGGITQSVGAFDCDGTTFIDTPGHAAFEDMRKRGAVATDVVVLVVAADDGVMPQTVEAIKHAKLAGVPIVVAINKMDQPGADPDKVRHQLLQFANVNTEQIGGETLCVEVSAKNGNGLKNLLDAIALQAELTEVGVVLSGEQGKMVCIESNMRKDFGNMATVVVRGGEVNVGDFVLFQDQDALSGELYGKIRAMMGMNGEMVKKAEVGTAVGIVGIGRQIPPGALCMVVEEKVAKKMSREFVAQNERALRTLQLANKKIEEIENEENEEMVGEEKKGVLNVVVKGAVQGSADAVANVLKAVGTKDYRIRILEVGAGEVTMGDVKLACATGKNKNNTDDTLIVAFGVKVGEAVRKLAVRGNTRILEHNLIYKLEDEVKELVQTNLRKWETTEECSGKANVVRVFGEGLVAGCKVEEGELMVGRKARVWRFEKEGLERSVVHEGVVESLKKFAKDVESVEKGNECGVGLGEWDGFEQGDVVEAVELVKGIHVK